MLTSIVFFFTTIVTVNLVTSSCVTCPTYVALSSSAKLDMLWGKITSSQYGGTYPTSWPSPLGLFSMSVDTTFDRYADELPGNRQRLVHSYGTIAKITYVVTPNSLKLTGIYGGGSTTALLRLSLAGQPGSFSPGFALKFLVDGYDSLNIIGMYGLDGQGTTNYKFFTNPLKTRIRNPAAPSFFTEQGQHLFEQGASPSTILLPDQPSLRDSTGTLATPTPVWPWTLYLVPNTAGLAFLPNSTIGRDFRADLALIPSGTLLYIVYAVMGDCICNGDQCDNPLDVNANCGATEIGRITTASTFVASSYGDARIFFQHSRFNKKARSTCAFATAVDDSNMDSTLLASSDGKKTCMSLTCPVTGLTTTTSGCTVEDSVLGGNPNNGKLSSGAIAGIVIGVIALIALIGGMFMARNKHMLCFKTAEGGGGGDGIEATAAGGGSIKGFVDLNSTAGMPAIQQQQRGNGNGMSPNTFNRLQAFYQIHDPTKDTAEITKIVKHFTQYGGERALQAKLVERYGVGLPVEGGNSNGMV